MALANSLCLLREGEPVSLFRLDDGPIEIGAHPTCDITLHDPGVPRRALLIQPQGGSVYTFDLQKGPGLNRKRVLPLDSPIPIGAGYSIVRRADTHLPDDEVRTEFIEHRTSSAASFVAVLGRGLEARSIRIGAEPLSIGCAPDNRLPISDRAVSRYHCRVEPSGHGVIVRDLGSTNGTWVDGLRVERAELCAGASLRVGRTEVRLLSEGGRRNQPSPTIVASSPPMLSVLADIDRFAVLPWPVLICGETGVGKERVARALHDRGPRNGGAFIALNAGGLPRELVESELFGHEKGAFTGAVRAHRGAFERADGGTLFLDEIAELPRDLQTRLLRVLETWSLRRVGSEQQRRVEVRLLCATHRDLAVMVREGSFRADLYYRIHRLVIDVPPLRARPDDIEGLAHHFLGGMPVPLGERRITKEALARLLAYSWPGNVRELRNVLELAAAHSTGRWVDADDIDRSLQRAANPECLRPSVDSMREAVARYDGNTSAAARALGIPRSTLRDRLRTGAA